MTKVFIDGREGTTGLRIMERLGARKDIELLMIDEALRKDPEARREMISKSDVTFLCLPDAAAIEAVALAEGSKVSIIDTSTAHRVNPAWAYGFPELAGAREAIAASKRIANPGCHASGFIALIAPLVRAGLLSPDVSLSCTSLTGYTGGGKKMIAEYEATERDPLLDAPRTYGLSQTHKHLPEMTAVCGLEKTPIFLPIVAPFACGMEVSIGLFADQLKGNIENVREIYREAYATGLVRFVESADENGFLSAGAFAGRDDMQLTVTGNAERMMLTARFDNLGKGASGAAIQNMNILLGLDEKTGLCVE